MRDGDRLARALLIVLVLAALVRLALLGAYPLTDTTEARYAELAREMLATGNWITPQLDPGVPFWGKPPAAIWLTALSLSAFGVNAFAARLPQFVLGALICLLVYRFARREPAVRRALLAVVILATTPLFFVASGAVMTDVMLALGTTLAMIGFWRTLNVPHGSPASCVDRYAFFVGIALGLLSKGPVAAVLTLLPVGAWVLATGRLRDTLQRLPWVSGGILLLALSLPWYLLAELRTPGFLDYFIIGEHWRRFTQPGWTGDLYGYVHLSPRGMVWLYALAAAFPWCLVALAALALRRTGGARAEDRTRTWVLYLACWMLAPVLFFTLARNILWTYVLPGLPAFALLAAHLLNRFPQPLLVRSSWLAASVPASAAALAAFVLPAYLPGLSQHALVARYLAERGATESKLLYLPKTPDSAQFYSQGAARNLDWSAVPALDHLHGDLLALRATDFATLPERLRRRVEVLQHSGGWLLLRETGQRAPR